MKLIRKRMDWNAYQQTSRLSIWQRSYLKEMSNGRTMRGNWGWWANKGGYLFTVKSLSFSKLVECVCVLVECALFWRRCESDAARILCTLVKTAPQHICVYFSGDLMDRHMYSGHQLQQLWKVGFSLRFKAELDMASILVSVASAAVCNSNCKCNQVAAANSDQVNPAKGLKLPRQPRGLKPLQENFREKLGKVWRKPFCLKIYYCNEI